MARVTAAAGGGGGAGGVDPRAQEHPHAMGEAKKKKKKWQYSTWHTWGLVDRAGEPLLTINSGNSFVH